MIRESGFFGPPCIWLSFYSDLSALTRRDARWNISLWSIKKFSEITKYL